MKRINRRSTVTTALVGLALVAGACSDGFSLGVQGQAESDGQVVQPTNPVNGQEGQPSDSGSEQATLPPPTPVPDEPDPQPVNTAPPTTAPPTTDEPPTTAPPTTEPPSTEPPTTEPPSTEPPLSEIKIMLIRFQAISDCDGVEGVGEFNFQALVSTPDGTVHGQASDSPYLSDNEYANQLVPVSLQLPPTEGTEFTVRFESTETDKDIFGTVFSDSRMDGLTVSQTHVYRNGLWTSPIAESTGLGGTYPNAIQLQAGSGNCSAELHYVLDIS